MAAWPEKSQVCIKTFIQASCVREETRLLEEAAFCGRAQVEPILGPRAHQTSRLRYRLRPAVDKRFMIDGLATH